MNTTMFDAENQFVGAVLAADLPTARALMAGLAPADFARPMTAHVAALAMQVMAHGHAPDPAALYTHAVATGQAVGEHRITWLARDLAELYEAAPPPAMGGHYRGLLLDAAYRRRVATYARRLLQTAESGVELARLLSLLDDQPHDDRITVPDVALYEPPQLAPRTERTAA